MSRVTKTVSLKPGPGEVIDYLADVRNHPGFIPALTDVGEPTGDPRSVGTDWEWTYEMAGVALTGSAATVAYEPGRTFHFATTGGIKSTFAYDAAPRNGGTELTIDVSYDVPETVLAKALDRTVIETFNDRIGDQAAENLRTVFND
jgi:hypothetical protein